jgi:endoglucanase
MKLINSPGRAARGMSRMALIGAACLAVVLPSIAQQQPASSPGSAQPPPKFSDVHGRLSVKGNKIVDKNGVPTTLHGMSLYCWAQQGWQFFNTEAINHFAQDWKCTVIRIAIRPQDYSSNPTKEIAKVKTVMDACISNGIYGIIDWHSMRGADRTLASSQEFFSTLATMYGKTPNIMYEPWNEPESDVWATTIKPYHEAVIAKIRAIDPDSIVICGNRQWDQLPEEASKNPITMSSNIAYSIHFYAASHKQSLRNNGAAALKNGVALFSTEYGLSSSSGNGTIDPAEGQLWWNWLDENNVGCANWSAAALGETSAAFQGRGNVSATGPWTDDMLKPSGILVRNYIISKYVAPK